MCGHKLTHCFVITATRNGGFMSWRLVRLVRYELFPTREDQSAPFVRPDSLVSTSSASIPPLAPSIVTWVFHLLLVQGAIQASGKTDVCGLRSPSHPATASICALRAFFHLSALCAAPIPGRSFELLRTVLSIKAIANSKS